MTKKDIALIAQVLYKVKPAQVGERRRQWDNTVAAFSNYLLDHNPRFSMGKFGRAAEVGLDYDPSTEAARNA